jgi:hypothetical protein
MAMLWAFVPMMPATAQWQGLQEPQKSVFAAFPEADGYQAIVRDVDVASRRAIEAALPFRVHFNELGSHVVYVALRGDQPLGFVYARTEESAWGLAQVEWAMTLELRVVGFRFERARSRQPHPVETSEFGRQLIGQGRSGLIALLDGEGHLRAGTRGVLAGDEDLAELVVRSGLKAIAVADTVWPRDLLRLREQALGVQAFPTARRYQCVWPRENVAVADEAPGPRVELAVRAFDARGQLLGLVAEVEVATPTSDSPARLRWTLDAAGASTAVVQVAGRVDGVLRSAALACRGVDLQVLARSDSVLAPVAKRLQTVLTAPEEGRKQ